MFKKEKYKLLKLEEAFKPKDENGNMIEVNLRNTPKMFFSVRNSLTFLTSSVTLMEGYITVDARIIQNNPETGLPVPVSG